MSRVDGFSDVIFGFALTLLVVSLGGAPHLRPLLLVPDDGLAGALPLLPPLQPRRRGHPRLERGVGIASVGLLSCAVAALLPAPLAGWTGLTYLLVAPVRLAVRRYSRRSLERAKISLEPEPQAPKPHNC